MTKGSILLFGAALLCSSALRAGTVCATPDTLQLGCIYTNFGAAQSYQQDGNGLTPGYSAVGVAFIPGASFQLEHIEVAAFRANEETADQVNFSVYSSTGGLPGDLLETFAMTGLGVFEGEPGPGTILGTSLLRPLLSVGMEYWLVMDGVNPGDVTWSFNSTGRFGAATVIAPVPDGEAAHWELLPNHSQGAFALDGAPVPEPSTLVPSAALLLAAAMVRRRRRLE